MNPTPCPDDACGDLRGGRLPATRAELVAAVDDLVARVQDAPRFVASPDVKTLVRGIGLAVTLNPDMLDRILAYLATDD